MLHTGVYKVVKFCTQVFIQMKSPNGIKEKKNYRSNTRFHGNQYVSNSDSKESNKASSFEPNTRQAVVGRKRPSQEDKETTESETINVLSCAIETPCSQKRLFIEDLSL